MSVWVISVGKLGLTKLLFVVKKFSISLSIALKWEWRYRHPESPKIPSDIHAPGRWDAGLRSTCSTCRPALTFHSASNATGVGCWGSKIPVLAGYECSCQADQAGGTSWVVATCRWIKHTFTQIRCYSVEGFSFLFIVLWSVSRCTVL